MDRHAKHLTLLMKVAAAAEGHSQAKIAAAVVRHNRVLAFGTNSSKTDPMQDRFKKNPEAIHIHAEIAALKGALNTNPLTYVRGSLLYVARSKLIRQKNGTFKESWGMAKPCEGCARALTTFDIERVYYTTDINNQYSCH